MLESSTIVPALRDLKISQGDQVLLYMRNLPPKAAASDVGTVADIFRGVQIFFIRMRMKR